MKCKFCGNELIKEKDIKDAFKCETCNKTFDDELDEIYADPLAPIGITDNALKVIFQFFAEKSTPRIIEQMQNEIKHLENCRKKEA